ncbi:hypothetical protein AVEN_141105-1 [Araneus ventricosus]|uniref:Histone-lysine N-methyltransferase SETMAR n=1 Tax=Araneus ventricosus TaxID=182803 RepID=A0A4Y2RK53_ARAVE|nr:hypothetical protein AVEN_141105-1 [Araneus ventricosus]
MLVDGRLLHDHARPQAALRTQKPLYRFRWEEFDHPAYSPDLAPSDYHPFQYLKRFLAGQHFPSDDDMQTTVTSLRRGLLRHRHAEISVMV